MLKLYLPIFILIITCSNFNWWSLSLATMTIMVMLMPLTLLSNTQILLSKMSTLDNMSYMLVFLTMFITVMMFMSSSKIMYFYMNSKLFSILSTVLMLILIYSFSSSSLIMFYIWFEASLIPTLFIILLWGYQPERMQASMYLMMYTLTASLPMLSMIMLMYYSNKSMSFLMLYSSMNIMWQSKAMWFLLILGFLVKLPMYISHLWLPKAHVEAPIAGSMILAAILLKLGGYGLIRMSLLHPISIMPMNMLIILSLIGALMTSLTCLRQPDMKSLIAYSSVGHMGLLIVGTMSLTSWGVNGAIIMMIAHGLCSSALFIMANISYLMNHTRSSYLTKGMMLMVPQMSMWWFMLLATNMAAPPTINLLSEIMIIVSALSKSLTLMIIMFMVSFFSATYSLHLFSITQHGKSMTFSNSMKNMSTQDHLTILSHIIPTLMLITKPDLMII